MANIEDLMIERMKQNNENGDDDLINDEEDLVDGFRESKVVPAIEAPIEVCFTPDMVKKALNKAEESIILQML